MKGITIGRESRLKSSWGHGGKGGPTKELVCRSKEEGIEGTHKVLIVVTCSDITWELMGGEKETWRRVCGRGERLKKNDSISYRS